MAPNIQIMTEAEKFDLLRQKVSATGQDAFRVRILKREAAHITPDLMATFDGVTVDSLASTEQWLPELTGGGIFELGVMHSGDITTQLCSFKFNYPSFPVKRMTTQQLHEHINGEGYLGPRTVVYPKLVAAQAVERPPAGVVTPMPSTVATGGPATPDLNAIRNQGSPQQAQEAARLTLVQEFMMRQEKELSKREMDLKMEALKNELKSGAVAPKGMDIAGMLTAAAPFLIAYLDSQQKSADRMFQMQMDAQTRQMEMMKLMTAKQEMDPAMRELLQKATQKDDMGMLKNVTEMMGAMASTTMQIIQSNAELAAASQPQQDSPQMKLAQTAMKVIGAVLTKGQAVVEEHAEAQAPQEQQAALPAGEELQVTQTKPKYNKLQLLERALVRKDPREKVAKLFIKALNSPKFNAFVKFKYQGDYMAMLNDRVPQWQDANGNFWMAQEGNIEYIQETGQFMWEEAKKAGFFPEPAPKAAPVQAAPAAPPSKKNGKHAPAAPATEEIPPPEPSLEVKEAVPTA